jgi:putative ABC transport system permease protein
VTTVFLQLGPMLRSLLRRKSAFALVVLEMASGFTILGCLLTIGSYYLGLGHQPSGHDEANLVRVTVQEAAVADPGAALTMAVARQQATLARLRALPGVQGAAAVSATMLDDDWVFPTLFAGAIGGGRVAPEAFGYVVHTEPAAIDVLSLRFLEGAPPPATAADTLEGEVILTRCLRQRLFPGATPALGARVTGDDGTTLRVRAVVEDVFMRTPLLQHAECVAFDFTPRIDERRAQYLVRAQPGRRAEVQAAVTQAMGAATAARYVAVAAFDSGKGLHAGLVRALVVILAIMGAVVALLALLGALAVSSFLVAERTHQVGVRRALGARRGDVVAYFLVESTIATMLGTALGLGFTVALFMLMRRAFPDIQLRASHLVFTAGLLWLDGMLAALLPARRAAQIPPSVASRAAS